MIVGRDYLRSSPRPALCQQSRCVRAEGTCSDNADIHLLLLLSCCRPASERHNRKCVCRPSERDLVAALERKNVSGFAWGRDRMTELLQNAPDFRHLLRV